MARRWETSFFVFFSFFLYMRFWVSDVNIVWKLVTFSVIWSSIPHIYSTNLWIVQVITPKCCRHFIWKKFICEILKKESASKYIFNVPSSFGDHHSAIENLPFIKANVKFIKDPLIERGTLMKGVSAGVYNPTESGQTAKLHFCKCQMSCLTGWKRSATPISSANRDWLSCLIGY